MNRSSWSAFCVGVLLPLAASVLTWPVQADEKDTSAERPNISGVVVIPNAIHDAMQSRRYEDAVKLLESEIQKDDVESADYLLYLKGIALTRSDQRVEAVKALTDLERRYPTSRWISRSRFGRAAIAVMNRQYDAAGSIYRAEADRLLSRGRKDELAKIYLEFADQFFEPPASSDPSKAKQPDYRQALEYYREAEKLGTTIAKQQLIEIRIARCLEELDQLDDAISAYQQFLTKHGDDRPSSGAAASIELQSDSMYRLGLCQLKHGQFSAARRTWQDLLSKHEPPLDQSPAVAQRLADAKYRLAQTYGLPKPATVGDLELGVALAEQFLRAYPEHALAPKAELEIAQGYESHRRNVQAIERLESLIANPIYEDSKQLAVARRMLGQSYLGQADFDKAIRAWKVFLEKHPTDSQWPDVQQRIIGAEFAAAEHARKEKEYADAREMWQTFLNKYPLDHRAPNILYQFGEMNYEDASARHQVRVEAAADNGRPASEVEPDQVCRQLFEDAISDWQRLVAKYPDSDQASMASLWIGITLEERLGRRKEALQAYKEVSGTSEQNAKQRIARLIRPELQIVTQRKFRSDEDASILLTTRNIESVSVAVYSIDMTDYFRKMHLATGIEKLDIALIDPDQQFKHSVAGYEPYKQIDQEVQIPVDGPGVTAVTVSSDKMEATTMVVVSDLDILVKSSRNEVFVFAQNMRSGKPAAGVSVLVSDGASVFTELVTDNEGIVRSQSDELQSMNDLRVFAVGEGHIASTVTSLDGLDFSVGLVPSGFLFTDRPVYRPGELVNIKGIVRWVDQDRFTFQDGESLTLDVYDSRGRKLLSEKVTLNSFGTIHTNLILPDSAVPGNCRVHLHRSSSKDRPELSFESHFEVKQYHLEPVQLSIESDKSVYFRGDEITAKVSLQYHYGAPLAGQEIRYWIDGDDEIQTAKTDGEGKYELKIPTRRFSESQPIAINVDCPQRNVWQSYVVFLATRGFTIDVKTTRSVFITGETFDASVSVVDPAGNPVATSLKLQLLELTSDSDVGPAGTAGERLVESFDLATDTERGQATKTIKVDRSGRYIVRATGTDQFQNSVSGQARLRISGDDDSTRLRILADTHHYNVGDEAEVVLHWRESPSLALITFDGAFILGHRLVNLVRGENTLRIPINAELAPNFYLSATVMQRSKLHHADSKFTVAKRLNIKLTESKTEVKPTERVKVGIEVTDSNGRPVEAELAMAVVQSNLLDQFESPRPDIIDAFSSDLRRRRMRHSSSCTFSYQTETRSINEALLLESERRSRRSAEAAALAELALGDATVAGDFAIEGYRFGGPADVDFENSPTQSNDLFSQQNANVNQWQALDQFPSTRGAYINGPFAKQSLKNLLPDAAQQNAKHSQQLAWDRFNSRRTRVQSASELNRSDNAFLRQRSVTVNGLTADGRLLVINGIDDEQFAQLTRREGARVMAAATTGETGFWDPVIVTGKQGKAEIEITMPAETTAWRLVTRAVTADAVVGSASTEIVTRKTLFGQLRIPAAFTVGDHANVSVEIHNSLPGRRDIDVTLKATMGNQSLRQTQALTVTDQGVETLVFPVEIVSADEVRFELTVDTNGETADKTLSTAEVLPYGFPVYQTSSGTASQNTIALVRLDPKHKARGESLELVIGGNINQSLLDGLLRSDRLLPLRCIATSQLSRDASDCLAGVALLQSVRRSAQNNSPQATRIAERIVSAVSNLIAAQRDDGGWSLSGRSDGDADPMTTARLMRALDAARGAGFAVPGGQFESGIASLKAAFAAESDLDRQSVLLSALAECGAGDFALANRLYRERNRLGDHGLVHLMLALTSLNHHEMAGELSSLVKLDASDVDPSFSGTSVEVAALQLIALQRIQQRGELRSKLADRLIAARVGSRWPVESDNGPAIMALAAHFGDRPPARERISLTIYVNGDEIEKLTLEPGEESRRIVVPAESLDAEEQKIEFELDGRGEFSYSAVLSGFSDAESLASTTQDWSVKRRYEPDQLRLDGRTIPRGHGVVNGGYSWTPNDLTELPVGVRGDVTLSPRVRYRNSQPQRTYLMLVEPIPAGCTVLEESINGVFDRYEITPGAITFYIGDRKTPGDIRYTLAGYLPGDYRSVPAVLRSYYSPSQIAVSEPGTLRVLPAGARSADEYRLTPDELFELGKLYFAKQEYQKAFDSLDQLLTQWQIDTDPFRDSATLLFRSSMHLENAADTVKFFEILKERFPEVELSFEEIQNVASAYREIAEYERSYLVYRATVQASFEKENQVAGFLNARGEFLRSVQAMEALLRDYPAESYVATASYALAQEVYRRADIVAEDPKLVEAGVTRVDLVDSSIRMLDDFLTNWPEDPSSDQASFALATALIDLKQYQRAIGRSTQYAERFPDSRLLDSFWYMIGFCYFELQDHQRALEMCRKVAEATFAEPESGGTRQADNKWEAIYIMGQIHHSLGQAAQAIEQYTKVAERFKDAAEAIEFFSRKSVSLPDVTTLLPEEKNEVLLQHRNVAEVLIKVYRIDLMKFGLTRRNLDRITAINLAGIRPYHQETVTLGEGTDYRNRETKVTLPLDEQGAYLVVCRADNLYSSGLVVVSPLSLTIEEDQVSGRVRVNVKDKVKDAFVGDVDVKVIGSVNSEFVSGQTDLRGVFVADAISGTTTVIALTRENQYAFYRGETYLGNDFGHDTNSEPNQAEMQTPAEPYGQPSDEAGKALLNNLFMQNGVFQQEQKLNIDGLMNNKRKGVQTKEAY